MLIHKTAAIVDYLQIKWYIHPKIKIQSLSTYTHVNLKMNELSFFRWTVAAP